MTPEAIAFKTAPIITFGYVMQVIISLAIVIAFIYFIGKYLLPKMKTTGSSGLIEIADRAYLEPQVTAYVLKVRKEKWLVVVSSKSVSKIDKLEPND